MDRVVQQNAATAEESASASEEMSAQTEQMSAMVNELVTLVGRSGKGVERITPSDNRLPAPQGNPVVLNFLNKMILWLKKESK